jgi:hypothetical protein
MIYSSFIILFYIIFIDCKELFRQNWFVLVLFVCLFVVFFLKKIFHFIVGIRMIMQMFNYLMEQRKIKIGFQIHSYIFRKTIHTLACPNVVL